MQLIAITREVSPSINNTESFRVLGLLSELGVANPNYLANFAIVRLTAITREVSASINDCQLSFHSRQPIHVDKAIAQHKAYQDCLAELGVRIVSLHAEPELPDAVFVEDPAVVVDEVAVIPIMGAPSRRPEARSLADALSRYRPIKFLVEPATLDGGDVLRVGRSIFVGLSQRTNREGFSQLSDLLRPYDYQVQAIEVRGCLHLKSACSYIGNDAVLINRSLIDVEPLRGFELIDVPEEEPTAANVLLVNDVVIMPKSNFGRPASLATLKGSVAPAVKFGEERQTPDIFSKTRVLLEERGVCVQTIDMSELHKAEAGVTCCCVIFDDKAPGGGNGDQWDSSQCNAFSPCGAL